MGVLDAGEPVLRVTLAELFLAIDGPTIKALAIGIDPRITRIVQRTHSGRCGQRLEDHLLAVAESGWEEQAFPGERLDGLRGRPGPGERLEEVGDHLADLGVRVEDYIANLIIDEAGRQGAAIFTAAHLVEDTAAQSSFDDMQLGFAHCALEPEQKAIIKVGRVVHTIFVEDDLRRHHQGLLRRRRGHHRANRSRRRRADGHAQRSASHDQGLAPVPR